MLLAKKWFIEIDELDRAERRILNFGHTFGHALEAATGYALPHGVAVAVGVLGATAHPAGRVHGPPTRCGRHCTELIGLVPGCRAARRLPAATGGVRTGVPTDKKHCGECVTPDPSARRRAVGARYGSVDDAGTGPRGEAITDGTSTLRE